jgi:hypothetical protein
MGSSPTVTMKGGVLFCSAEKSGQYQLFMYQIKDVLK